MATVRYFASNRGLGHRSHLGATAYAFYTEATVDLTSYMPRFATAATSEGPGHLQPRLAQPPSPMFILRPFWSGVKAIWLTMSVATSAIRAVVPSDEYRCKGNVVIFEREPRFPC